MHALIQEKRPLKRSRLGPPDVYPQEAKQKEDELTPANVKHGYSTIPPLSDEFGTAHNSNVTSVRVASFLNSVISKKEELLTLQDTGRKKQQINCKDNFWPVSPRTKGALDAWFKDLAGNKPLLSLAKKAPSFNKKEDIFITLCDNQVNMQRATWFIKLSAAYTLSFTESKNKKRSIYDPAADWTSNITKFLKEVLHKLQEHQNPVDKSTSSGIGVILTQNVNITSLSNTSSMSAFPSVSSPASSLSPASVQQSSTVSNSCSSLSGLGSNFDDCRNAMKYWKYCSQLSKYMYEEALLDRQEFLNWILELIDKIRLPVFVDGAIKKLILSFALQFMQDFVQSERMCRKLAYIVAKKLSNFPNTGSNKLKQKYTKSAMLSFLEDDEYKQACNEFSENIMRDAISCPHHHDIIVYLSTILQIITIECPTALVWCGIGESRPSSSLSGSPLDSLIIPPSALPMPLKCENSNNEIRKQLYTAEAEIVHRSRHAENRWFSEKWLDAKKSAYAHILSVLDYLDTHCFDRIDQTNSIHSLYANVFPPITSLSRKNNAEFDAKEGKYDPKQDADTVKILCEWAVSNQRWGEHRAFVVAILLDKRQIDVTLPQDIGHFNNGNSFKQQNEDAESIASGVGLIGGLPVFQSILMDYLDKDAPVLDENSSAQNRVQFTNLVHLFSTLIRYDVFSHNAYLHTLISRGDLVTENNRFNHMSSIAKSMERTTAATGTLGAASVSNKSSSPVHAFEDEFSSNIDFKQSEFDDSNVDDDLDKLLQNIKEKGQQNALEAPDSPKIPDQANSSNNPSLVSRHFVYTKHFPIPQEDSTCWYSSESNQRYILLFGIGKERDEKKHAVKKMVKDICKLFSKKFSIDVAEGGKVKKHSRNEFNFEATINKCQTMAYFDQHVITYQCAVTVLEQLNGFAIGNNNYLPVQEHIAFLFDLMEMALNIFSLLELCDNILKELPEVEIQLQAKKSNLIRNYTTSTALYIVGILRRYHCCLLLSFEQTIAMFEGLCKTIKHVVNPSECSSAERCILAYLSDLYDSCAVIGTLDNIQRYHQFALIKRFKELLVVPEHLSLTSQVHNPQFLQELFTSPRRGGKVDTAWIRQVQESPSNMYSLVSNAFLAVCRETDNDRLNDIAISCAELTASCTPLAEEWIAALQSICNAPKKARYPHLFGQVDIHNSKVHNSLSIFICILVARHCFSLSDFVGNFALPTLANAYPVGGEITSDAEAGARLTCHLVLKLFKTIEIPQPGLYFVGTSPNPINVVSGGFNIKLSCDRHLLVGAHKNIPIEAVLAVLKAILIVVDKKKQPSSLNVGFGSGKRSGFNTPVHPGSTPKNNERPADLSQILGTSDLSSLSIEQEIDFSQTSTANNSSSDQISLLDFAYHVLKQICAQEHVLERCLKNSEKLCDMIIDEMLTTKQVQRVLHMICYPESEYNIISELDQRSMITRILENLKQWTLRISWLDLQLMYRQSANNPTELNNWLDTVARAAIDVFQMEEVSKGSNDNQTVYRAKPSTWLVTPLILKLTPAVQGRILRIAGQVLENMTYFSKLPKADISCSGSGDEREKNNSCSSVHTATYTGKPNSLRTKKSPLNYKPLLGLILSCLKGQDDHKEGLLFSLFTQLTQFLQSFTEIETLCANDDFYSREDILDALQVRFSLIGGMFDLIKKSGTLTTDWAILLAQLVCQGVIDHNSNKELLTTVVDMLATLVHFTLTSDSHSDRDENKKLYINLMKKLKKEIGEKNNTSIKVIRQLLPLYKQATEVISCEPAGVDMKGNKICDVEKKQLRISDKQRISVWDILEGHKNPAPLSWVWFGAVKVERKPLFFEESHKSLKYHSHSLNKPSSFYFESLPLPPEEVEQNAEKVPIRDEMKADTPSSVDQSPSASVSGRSRNKSAVARKRKQKTPKTPPVSSSLTPQHVQQQQPQQLQSQAIPSQQVNQNQAAAQQISPAQLNAMQINMQVSMAQFGGNTLMQQNPNQVIQHQLQQSAGNLQTIGGNLQQNSQMNYMGTGSNPQGLTHNSQQQQWVGQNQYHNVQQPQQQSFYQQAVQINRFERPPINNSKQALSNMLRQRQPAFNQNNPSTFNTLPPQRQTNSLQPQQQQQQVSLTSVHQQQAQQHIQQQQYARGTLRVMNPTQVGNSGANLNTSIAMNQNQILPSQGVNPQQNAQSLSINTVNNNNSSIMNQQVGGGLVNTNVMLQPNNGVNVTVGVNNNNVGTALNQANQFQGFNQFQQQPHNSNAAPKQSNMAYNQMNSQRNTVDFIAQQQRTGLINNRGQFINSAPNVTMNNIGQNNVQSYSRQASAVGKPGIITPQQQFPPHRIHHQMMQLQGNQLNIGQQSSGTAVINQQQSQGVPQQQNPNLIAQLQIQMPGPSNLIGQQYQHQAPPY